MPEDTKSPSEELKVTDRRSFTPSGERRAPDQPTSDAPGGGRTPLLPETDPSGPDEEGGIAFESFAQYLAQIAIHQLSASVNPSTEEGTARLAEARQTIEILEMLKKKTRGNLTSRESGTLDELLYHLKLEYARRAVGSPR